MVPSLQIVGSGDHVRQPAFAATCAPGERRQSGSTVITSAVVGSPGVEMSSDSPRSRHMPSPRFRVWQQPSWNPGCLDKLCTPPPGHALPWSARLDMSLVAAGRPGTCPSLVAAIGHSGIMSSPRCRSWTCPADKHVEPAWMNEQGRARPGRAWLLGPGRTRAECGGPASAIRRSRLLPLLRGCARTPGRRLRRRRRCARRRAGRGSGRRPWAPPGS